MSYILYGYADVSSLVGLYLYSVLPKDFIIIDIIILLFIMTSTIYLWGVNLKKIEVIFKYYRKIINYLYDIILKLYSAILYKFKGKSPMEMMNIDTLEEEEELLLPDTDFLTANLQEDIRKVDELNEDMQVIQKPVLKPQKKISIKQSDAQIYSVPLKLLVEEPKEKNISKEQMIKQARDKGISLGNVIREFGIESKLVNISVGPVITLYEIQIPPGIKSSKILSLESDIALRMKAISVRISIIPGKDVLGVEIPNDNRKTIYLKKILQSNEFTNTSGALPIVLGSDIYGASQIVDLAAMPHLLIAGTTGSGKSVGINSMILSLIYKFSPSKCKMILIDPKMLELSIYNNIPHLLSPVVIDPKKAVSTLKWAVKEMENRYYQMSLLGVRNINGYNEMIQNEEQRLNIQAKIKQEKEIDIEFEFLPYIVIVIDEMADLMMVAGKEVESAVQRLAQMARAAGIHMIMATQRPSVDVITGTIKANFPTRLSFQVSSKIDSRTILGEQGAEQLLGKGDLLFMFGAGRVSRIHGPFVSDGEVLNVVNHIKSYGIPNYSNIEKDITSNPDISILGEETNKDALYNDAINIIKSDKKISVSYLQRRLQIGYNRAARIVDMLEEEGIISSPTSTGKREILI